MRLKVVFPNRSVVLGFSISNVTIRFESQLFLKRTLCWKVISNSRRSNCSQLAAGDSFFLPKYPSKIFTLDSLPEQTAGVLVPKSHKQIIIITNNKSLQPVWLCFGLLTPSYQEDPSFISIYSKDRFEEWRYWIIWPLDSEEDVSLF